MCKDCLTFLSFLDARPVRGWATPGHSQSRGCCVLVGGTPRDPATLLLAFQSEEYLQRELNEPGVCSLGRAGDDSKVLVIRRAAVGRGGSKLSSVKKVKEFSPEFET